MKVYTYSAARQRFADVLRRARREGQVQIRRRDGQVFTLRPERPDGSPLDVPGVESDLGAREIVELVRDSRRSTRRFVSRQPADKALQATSRSRKKSKRAQTARG